MNLLQHLHPSPQWFTETGPIEPHVLADIYGWLESHSGLSRSCVTTATTASAMGANTSSLNICTTSPSSRSYSER